MFLLFSLRPPPLLHPKPLSLHPPKAKLFKPHNPLAVKSLGKDSGHVVSPAKPKLEHVLSTLASLYPVYVTVGGAIACVNPSAFEWFVKRGPASYGFSLGLIMLAMGVTLELKELVTIFKENPLSVS
jgi:bile acid:Na+ symporter, BASS family